MDPLFVLLLIVFAFLGAPLFAIFGAASMILFGENGTITSVAVDVFSERFADSPTLVTLPLFTFAGYLMAEAGTPRRLVRVSRAFFGWMPGGLAIVCLVASAFFTTFTGGSGITIVAIGGLLFPALIQEKYREPFSLGLVTTGGSLGLLFPPSIPIVLYGVVAGILIDKLFLAGLIPGTITLVALGAYAYVVGGGDRRRLAVLLGVGAVVVAGLTVQTAEVRCDGREASSVCEAEVWTPLGTTEASAPLGQVREVAHDSLYASNGRAYRWPVSRDDIDPDSVVAEAGDVVVTEGEGPPQLTIVGPMADEMFEWRHAESGGARTFSKFGFGPEGDLLWLILIMLGGAVAVFVLPKPKGAEAKVTPERPPFDPKEAWEALWEVKWEAILPLVLVIGLATGFLRIHEAAAFTALYVLIIEVFVYKDIEIKKDLPRVIRESMTMLGAILAILATALGFTGFLIQARVPELMVEWMEDFISSPIAFLLALNLFLLVVGMLMDIFSAIVVVVPLIVPIARAFHIDPYHLGIVFLLNLEIGYLTPPVGLNLFISSFRFNRPVTKLYTSVLPFIVLLIISLVITAYVPSLSTALTSLIDTQEISADEIDNMGDPGMDLDGPGLDDLDDFGGDTLDTLDDLGGETLDDLGGETLDDLGGETLDDLGGETLDDLGGGAGGETLDDLGGGGGGETLDDL